MEEVARVFLSSSKRDAELVARGAVPELVEALRQEFDAPVASDIPPQEIRRILARHVLTAEFLEALGDEAPAALSAVARPKATALARRCAALAADWRDHRELAESYFEAAKAVEQSLHLAAMTFGLAALTRCETFLTTELAAPARSGPANRAGAGARR